MSTRFRIVAPLMASLALVVAAAAASPVSAVPGGTAPVRGVVPAVAEGDAIVMTPTTGPGLLVEAGVAGVDVVAADISAAPGATLDELGMSTTGAEALSCGTVPRQVTGATKVHCEQAIPVIPAGSTRRFTFTATAIVDGKEVTKALHFDVMALALKTTMTVNGEQREDTPIGPSRVGPAVAPGTTVSAALALENKGTTPLEIAMTGWTCPARTVGAGGRTTCTRTVTAPAQGGAPGLVQAEVKVKDADGRTGTVVRYGRFQTTGSPEAGLASTGLPVGGTLVVAFSMIALGLVGVRLGRR